MHTGLILRTIGEVLIGITVLRVHGRIFQDKRIDDIVLRAIRREQVLGILGIFLVIVGFIFEIQG